MLIKNVEQNVSIKYWKDPQWLKKMSELFLYLLIERSEEIYKHFTSSFNYRQTQEATSGKFMRNHFLGNTLS